MRIPAEVAGLTLHSSTRSEMIPIPRPVSIATTAIDRLNSSINFCLRSVISFRSSSAELSTSETASLFMSSIRIYSNIQDFRRHPVIDQLSDQGRRRNGPGAMEAGPGRQIFSRHLFERSRSENRHRQV